MQEEDRWLFLPSLRQPTPCSRRRETSAAVRCKGEIFRPHTTRDGLECYHVLRVHVIKQRACSLLAAQSAQIGRQRPLRARVASEPIRTRGYRPTAQVLVDILAHTAGSYQYATCASVKLQGRASFAS